jgi:senataxin
VLVCAPSNSALDEIVLRLLHTGLRDENGLMYTPSIVRVGLNAHHSVQSVTMDNLVSACTFVRPSNSFFMLVSDDFMSF